MGSNLKLETIVAAARTAATRAAIQRSRPLSVQVELDELSKIIQWRDSSIASVEEREKIPTFRVAGFTKGPTLPTGGPQLSWEYDRRKRRGVGAVEHPSGGPSAPGREALLEARTQASVALFKLGAHSATYAPTRIRRA